MHRKVCPISTRMKNHVKQVVSKVGDLPMPSTIDILCCYARKDQDLLENLKTHLMPLQRQGSITLWSDTNINAGDVWEKELHQHLDSAHIVLLLISADFIASDYAYSKEMTRALERHEQGDVRVIPIILRRTLWQNAPFAKLQVLPRDAKPVVNWQDKDEAFYDIAEQISLVVKELQVQQILREAQLLYEKQNYEGALILYDQVIQQDPQSVLAYRGKADALFSLERYQESLNTLKQMQSSAPTSVDADFYWRTSEIFNKLKCYRESLETIESAIYLDPQQISFML